VSTEPPEVFGEALRARLAAIADGLVPGADGMPVPSNIDIGGRQLDLVLASRPDLAGDLRRALEAAADVPDAIVWVETLRARDPAGYEAVVTAVVGGYYLHPDVTSRLRYPGQLPQQVRPDTLLDELDDGLLERVHERGPIYRPTPGG
jgi:hypothetical protein